jgi:hypothetical protein
MSEAPQPTLGRSCGTCTLCCKVYDVPPIDNKPAGKWCKHCKPGKGCGIWDTRPQFCRDYHCYWHYEAQLGPEWRPDVAKFILNLEPGGIWLAIVIDPGQPHAWKREPYHSILRSLSDQFITAGDKGLMLIEGDRKFVVLPDREVFIGNKMTNANVRLTKKKISGIVHYDVIFNETTAA